MPSSPERNYAPQRLRGVSPGDSPPSTDADDRSIADAPLTPSKSQRKRDALALQALGAQLVALAPGRLARIELPEALREAVVAVRDMHQHGARLRQMQYIGKLMRQLDADSLRLVREALDPRRAAMPRSQP